MKLGLLPMSMDAPGFYRLLSPGRQLAEHGETVLMPKYTYKRDGERYKVVFDFDPTFPSRNADVWVIQHRWERMWAESGIRKLRQHGCAVTMDLDDDYISLPAYNPAFYGTHPYRRHDGVILNRKMRRQQTHPLFKHKPPPNSFNRDHMIDALSQCDLVTVSTPYLAEVYSRFNPNIKVVRNYTDWDIWEHVVPQYEMERERVRIGYLGVFRYRRGDLEILQRVLPRFLRDHPEVDFVANSEEVHDYLNVPEFQRVTIGEYAFYDPDSEDMPVGRMTAVMDIGLIPLALNDLNQAKSHLKGLEYNSAGIPFIASPTESYKDYWCDESANGVIAFKESDWYEWMDCLVSDTELRKVMGKRGRIKARAHSIQQNWREWHDVYSELLGGEGHAFARKSISLGAVQKVSELGPFIDLVRERRPRTIVEIGTARGGTLWAMAQVAADDAMVVSIDIPAGSPLDLKNGEDVYTGRDRDRIKNFVKPTQSLRLIDLDSQKPETVAVLRHVLEGRKVDLLFIDGDHRYEGVKNDFENYLSFLSPGGMIAFHDIVTHHDKRVGVHKLWSELKELYPTREFIGPETWGYTPWGGIGVIDLG